MTSETKPDTIFGVTKNTQDWLTPKDKYHEEVGLTKQETEPRERKK